MVYYSRFQMIVVVLILLTGLLFAFPNFLPSDIRKEMPGWLPSSTVNLGLDLQGGAYMLLEVDIPGVTKERMESLRGDIRTGLRKAHIGYKQLDLAKGVVTVQITEAKDFDAARDILKRIAQPSSGALLGFGTQEYEMNENGTGSFTLRMTDAYLRELKNQIVTQSIEVVRRRIDQLGTREPAIQKQGEDRILVQVPGLKDPHQLEVMLSTTAKMTFQLVDEGRHGRRRKGPRAAGRHSSVGGRPRRQAAASLCRAAARDGFGRPSGEGIAGFQPTDRPAHRQFQIRFPRRTSVWRRDQEPMSDAALPSCSTTR